MCRLSLRVSSEIMPVKTAGKRSPKKLKVAAAVRVSSEYVWSKRGRKRRLTRSKVAAEVTKNDGAIAMDRESVLYKSQRNDLSSTTGRCFLPSLAYSLQPTVYSLSAPRFPFTSAHSGGLSYHVDKSKAQPHPKGSG